MINRTTEYERSFFFIYLLSGFIFFMSIFNGIAMAQELPGSADVGRIAPLEKTVIPERVPQKSTTPNVTQKNNIPDAAKDVTFFLRRITLEGGQAFTNGELAEIYQPHLNQEVPLASLWEIANQITQRYQNEGYFLSRAYVPAQEIDDGTVTIKIVEGYIDDVMMEDAALSENWLIQQLTDRLKAKRPLNAYDLESFMLQMNALPGKRFRAFVEPAKDALAGATRLVLRPETQPGQGSISFDNSGSRFLGPYQATATYQDSFIPLQQTTASILTSLPADELRYGALRHYIPIAPDWSVELSGSYVTSMPGATLEVNDIESSSINLGASLNWQPIRQRRENLSLSFSLNGQNTNGDILDNNPLTRDRIRTASILFNYDTDDHLNGYNYLNATLTQGLDILGSSKEGDLNLSRADAEPDFTTLQASYTRLQAVGQDWMAIGQLIGQFASAPLFSAQEFGYGGNSLGRAYDNSEITGDHGIAGSLELRYQQLNLWSELRTTPYIFYDIGRVWNEDSGSKPLSASSAGFGVRMDHETGISSNLGLAWPLTKEVDTAIYGDSNDPRILFNLSINF